MKNRQEGLIQHSIVLILNFLNADNQTTEEKDAKKKSYTSSELNIIVIYLWVGSKITVPCTNKQQQLEERGAHALHWDL